MIRPARWVFLKRAVPAAVLFALVQVGVERTWQWDIESWIVHRGIDAGCDAFLSRTYVVGEHGPFFGDDTKCARWNFLWRHATLAASTAAGLASAAAVYGLAAGPLGRTRAFGYRGPTRCGSCGYALAGLTEPRCPECGRCI